MRLRLRPRPLLIATAALGAAIQFVPYGHRRTSSHLGMEPAWDSGRTRDLFFRACADCHSNETQWPWYSHVAPVSWLVIRHVEEGRHKFNVSAWSTAMIDDAREAGHQVRKGKMPLRSYLLAHPAARLSAEEKAALIRGLDATVAASSDATAGE